MLKRIFSITSLVALALIMGCSESPNSQSDGTGIIDVADDDAEMNAAIAKAQESFNFFEDNWETMDSDGYSVKFALPTADGQLEHIWFSPTRITGNQVTGECANDPRGIPDLKLGDVKTVNRSKVSDWMIIDGDKCYGGYTIRVLRKQNPGAVPNFTFVDPPEN